MKQLILVRHAKSSWKDSSLADRDRPLNKRGKRDAPKMGRRWADRLRSADLLITSPARRARLTAEKMLEEAEIDPSRLRIDDDLYFSGMGVLVGLIHELPPAASSAVLFGHNPDLTLLANHLGDQDIDNVPTCGVVDLRFDVGGWEEIELGTGKVAEFDYPKKSKEG